MSSFNRPNTRTTRTLGAAEAAIELDELDDAIKSLRISYEKYFAGVERLEPQKERDRLKAILRRLRASPTPNTARRFRIQQLQASMVTHESYWNRICRQIEEGTFKRDRLRAERMLHDRERPVTAGGKSTAAPAAPPQTSRYPDHLVRLHADYEETRRKLGQAALTIDALARTVEKQTAAIKERYKCDDVEFRVVAKDGKPILKATPKTAK